MSKQENPFKGDTAWGDFKGTFLGGLIMGMGKLLFVLFQFTLVGLLIYGVLKATYCWLAKVWFRKPLPDFEDFPRGWYVIAVGFWLLMFWFYYCSQNGGCYTVLGVYSDLK